MIPLAAFVPFECIGLEPIIQQVAGGLRDQLGDLIQFSLLKALRISAELEQPIRSRRD